MGDRKVSEVADLTPTAWWRSQQAQPISRNSARPELAERILFKIHALRSGNSPERLKSALPQVTSKERRRTTGVKRGSVVNSGPRFRTGSGVWLIPDAPCNLSTGRKLHQVIFSLRHPTTLSTGLPRRGIQLLLSPQVPPIGSFDHDNIPTKSSVARIGTHSDVMNSAHSADHLPKAIGPSVSHTAVAPVPSTRSHMPVLLTSAGGGAPPSLNRSMVAM